MGVLNVKYRIVAALFRDLFQIEIERRLVIAGQHDEADDILANLVDNLAQGHKRAGAFGHLYRLAVIHQIHQAAQPHVEDTFALGDGRYRRLQPFDVSLVIDAPDVHHGRKAPAELVAVIGDIGGKIGPASIGFLQRPIHIVAKLRCPEQELRPLLPVFRRRLTFRGLERTGIDQIACLQLIDNPLDRSRVGKRLFRREHRMLYPEGREVLPDQIHHGIDRKTAKFREPVRFVHAGPAIAVARCNRFPDGNQIIAGVKPFGDCADILAKRFAVAQMGRACEHIDLRPGIVDVVFPADAETRLRQKRSQRVADNSAASMADMHRSGRVRGDIFHIHGLARADVAVSVARPLTENFGQARIPEGQRQPQIDKTRTGNLRRVDIVMKRQRGGKAFAQVAGLQSGRFGQHHRRIRRQIAHCLVTGRLD